MTITVVGEYLSKDILEEDFMKVFWSFRMLQMLMGSCRVDAKDRFVTAPTIYQRTYTILCAIIITAICTLSLYTFMNMFQSYIALYNICIAALSVHVFTYLSNIIHVRFLNSDSNVKLYIKMQEIDRLMKVEHNGALVSMLGLVNNTTIITLFVIFVILLCLAFSGGPLMIYGFLGMAVSHSVFLIEMSYCSNLMAYFTLRTRFINSIIANHMEPIITEKQSRGGWSKFDMRWLAAQTHDFTTSETDVYLKELCDCFSIFQNIYRFQVLLFFFNYFSFILFCFEFGIQYLQLPIVKIQDWIVMTTMLIVGCFQGIFLCIRCEAFYIEVKETKRLSVAIMSQNFDGPLREKAKNMVLMIEETPPCFSVYDMWNLDASVMLKSFAVLTTFLVTLLQFAFL